MITIFTPTYNRAYRLPALYESLQRQTCRDFEWLVVDDGSTDNTPALFEQWAKEANFTLRYLQQPNGGKHRAINRGAQEAQGEWFFIVDSDDYLTDDAVEKIVREAPSAFSEAGICFRRSDFQGNVLGSHFPESHFFASSLEIAFKYKISADKAEVFRTAVMRAYPFPEFEGENFVPEATAWNRIAERYKLYCVDEAIYRCEYLPDGLTQSFKRNLQRNPRGFGLFYGETMRRRDIPLFYRLKSFVRYLQCLCYRLRK